MSQATFSEILVLLEAFKRMFVFVSKVDFFPGVRPRFLVKSDQMFTLIPTPSFLGYFFVPGSPGGRKSVSQGTFSDTLIHFESFIEYLFFVQKLTFFRRGSSRGFVKNVHSF